MGDSRAYLLRAGSLDQLTADHSLVAEKVRIGILTPQEADASELQSVLTRAVGTSASVEVDTDEQMLLVGDSVLLCSDGLTRMVTDPEIASTLLTSTSAQEAADRLVDLANENGGADNVSVIVLRIDREVGGRARTPENLETKLRVRIAPASTGGEHRMSRLVLKFEGAALKEVPLGTRPVTIGRAPDNDIPIDNLAVSNYHARVYVEAGSLVVEDLNSLNGSFLNDIRVERAMLKDGDAILIGKHRHLGGPGARCGAAGGWHCAKRRRRA